MNNKSIYKVIIKNAIFIILLTVVFGIAGYFYAQHKQKTVYETTQNLIINHSYNGDSANEKLQSDLGLVKTYENVIEGNDTSRKARTYLPKNLQNKYSVDEINSMTSVHAIPETTMLRVSVKSPSAKTSAQITNAVTRAAESQISKRIPSGSVKRASSCDERDAKSITTPSRKKYTELGLALGFLVGILIAFSITTWTRLI